MVWALEAIPSLRKFSEIVDENALPRMMKWGNAKRVNSALVEVVLESGEVDVVRKLVPTEAEKEKAYFVMLREVEVEDDETTYDNAPEQSTGNVDYEKLKELVKIAVSEENKRMCEELVKIDEENKRMCALVDTLQRKVKLMEVRLSNEELNEMEDETVEASRNGKGNAVVEEKEAGEGDEKVGEFPLENESEGEERNEATEIEEEVDVIVNEVGDGDKEVGEVPPEYVSDGDKEVGDEVHAPVEATQIDEEGAAIVNEDGDGDKEVGEFPPENVSEGDKEVGDQPEALVEETVEETRNGEGNSVGEEINEDIEMEEEVAEKLTRLWNVM